MKLENKTEDPSVPDAWIGYRKGNPKDGTLKNLDLEGLRSQRARTTKNLDWHRPGSPKCRPLKVPGPQRAGTPKGQEP